MIGDGGGVGGGETMERVSGDIVSLLAKVIFNFKINLFSLFV